MSSDKRFGFVSIFVVLAGAACATGCATSATSLVGLAGSANAAMPDAPGLAMAQKASSGVEVGETRVVDAHVNPLVPVRLSASGDVIAVRFAHPRAAGALVHLDATSLAPLAPESAIDAERPAPAASGVARVVFGDGRFVAAWKQGDAEHGYRVMTQAWTSGGSSLGAPVAVSMPDADVIGAPELLSLQSDDGHRAVVTFTAMVGDRAELLAVSLLVL
jgi:hypothetical protein